MWSSLYAIELDFDTDWHAIVTIFSSSTQGTKDENKRRWDVEEILFAPPPPFYATV